MHVLSNRFWKDPSSSPWELELNQGSLELRSTLVPSRPTSSSRLPKDLAWRSKREGVVEGGTSRTALIRRHGQLRFRGRGQKNEKVQQRSFQRRPWLPFFSGEDRILRRQAANENNAAAYLLVGTNRRFLPGVAFRNLQDTIDLSACHQCWVGPLGFNSLVRLPEIASRERK